jgi:hypothetical protein
MRQLDPDATIRVPRRGDGRLADFPRRYLRAGLLCCAAVLGGLAVLLGGLFAPSVLQSGRGADGGGVVLPMADRQALLAAPTGSTAIYRYRPRPAVTVVLFDSLHDQALALNRIGAFVEKAGLPHDRVLDDASLAAAIAASGDSFDEYYLGHDYRAADLRRFFALADMEHVALRPAETWLRARLEEAGLLGENAPGALISLPPPAARGLMDAAGRSTILHHELAHGLYFTDAAYAGYVARFWQDGLTDEERGAFVRLLARQGYDPANVDVMRNECQAYLAFTDDGRYFSAAALGLTETHVAEMRRRFMGGLPAGWLAASGL